MLPSWPISLRESFDTTNPWVVRLTGFGRERTSQTDLRLSVAAGLVLFLVLGVAGLTVRNEDALFLIGATGYLLLVALALLAPALGASTRLRIDGDPALPELLTTPLPDRAYVAGMHGRILLLSVFGAVLYGIAGTTVLLATLKASGTPITLRFLDDLGGIVPLAMVVLAVNYGAGVLVHATWLASICQRAPRARTRGGLLTAALLVVMAVLLVPRLSLYALALVGLSKGKASMFLVPCALDGLLAVVRLLWARRLWERILATAMNETRQHLGLG